MDVLPGTRLGPYEVIAPLATGGMGAVYRARDTRLGREVAIKVLPPHLIDSPDALARFEREARAVAALSHPNILALHDVGRESSVAYAVTELLEGETLRDVVRRGPVQPRRALDVLTQIARGLGAAHDRGIVHRDIKPENIFLTRDGRVKILDFGVATQHDADVTIADASAAQLTQPGTMVGTLTYMSPEQLAALPATARSDLFAFGVVAHELLTGVHPFKRPTVSQMLGAILRDDPAPLVRVGALPPGVAGVLDRCLAKEPANRLGSARDLAHYLEALATAPDVPAEATGGRAPGTKTVVARRTFYVALATTLFIVALVWGYAAVMARRAVTGSITTDLARAQRLVQRVQDERLAHLALIARLIASFPELKALFGTDAATVHDFLVNQQTLIPGSPTLIALLPDGRILARSDSATARPVAADDTWIDVLLTKNSGPAVVTIGGRPYHAARAASDAGGNTFGHVVAALPVDQEFARALSDATHDEIMVLGDGIAASTLRDAETPWKSLRDWRQAGGRADRTVDIRLGTRRFQAQEIALSGQPALAAIVARSRDDVMGPSGQLPGGLFVIAAIGVAAAAAGAYWVARGSARA